MFGGKGFGRLQISARAAVDKSHLPHGRDNAGAYAIQHGGDEFVARIEGSLTNVMGLPMELPARLLGRVRRWSSLLTSQGGAGKISLRNLQRICNLISTVGRGGSLYL
jgi:hypothetical protein